MTQDSDTAMPLDARTSLTLSTWRRVEGGDPCDPATDIATMPADPLRFLREVSADPHGAARDGFAQRRRHAGRTEGWLCVSWRGQLQSAPALCEDLAGAWSEIADALARALDLDPEDWSAGDVLIEEDGLPRLRLAPSVPRALVDRLDERWAARAADA